VALVHRPEALVTAHGRPIRPVLFHAGRRRATVGVILASLVGSTGIGAPPGPLHDARIVGRQEPSDPLSSADSSAIIKISDSPLPCATCISITQLVTLGDTTGPGTLNNLGAGVVRDASGRYWVGQVNCIKIFDRNGKFLATIGRSGQGPMEFGTARPLLVDSSGRVHVFDRSNMRVTVIGPDLSHVTDYLAPGYVRSLVGITSGKYVASIWQSTASSLGEPLHLIEGEHIVRSFGHSLRPEDISQFNFDRVLALSRNNRLFSARMYSYEIGVWEGAGE